MLRLTKITKTYNVGDIETKALDEITVTFREKEFIAVLGTSGSGKTTLLNIIGGLDRYDSGDLIIKGRSTTDFKDSEWDAYRNNSIGFVFQSYNLINHLSIVDNVEIGMTLSGVSSKEKRQRALKVLDEVGLKDHLHKKPNQLSGGQMQRVAIARALANNPEILLCDEPTGALDTATSVQIMEVIKKVAKNRLVIMVTHNPDLAEKYADRIILFKDGKIIKDTNIFEDENIQGEFNLRKTNMSLFTAVYLSLNNIKTKKGRTLLTAFASSIGIIGIAIILSISSGFQVQINKFQEEAMAEFPITISERAMNVSIEGFEEKQNAFENKYKALKAYGTYDEVFLYDPAELNIAHDNKIDDNYIKYIEGLSPNICESIGYTRIVNMNILRKVEGKPITVNIPKGFNSANYGKNITSISGMGLSTYPVSLEGDSTFYLKKNYDLLAGEFPENPKELVLVVDSKNRIDFLSLNNLGFNTEEISSIKYKDLVGLQLKLINNDDYYIKTDFEIYIPGTNYEKMYDSQKSTELIISGIIRQKKDINVAMLGSGLSYSDGLTKLIIDENIGSEIVQEQKKSDFNVLTLDKIDDSKKEKLLSYLGGNNTPYIITIYPKNFASKDLVATYLNDYNKNLDPDEQIFYTDLAETITQMTSGIMNGITIILVAFAAISLVVSLIMICIITYTSVLERTKEIGILKALGARKKDIARVFDAETLILGIFSGTLGVFIAWIGTFPINSLIYRLAGLKDVSQLKLSHCILLIITSTVLTVIGGHIPAKIASKKDPVDALRTE